MTPLSFIMDDRQKKPVHYLRTLFPSLYTDMELCAFINRFGLLFYPEDEPPKDWLNEGTFKSRILADFAADKLKFLVNKPVLLSPYRQELHRYRMVIELYQSLHSGHYHHFSTDTRQALVLHFNAELEKEAPRVNFEKLAEQPERLNRAVLSLLLHWITIGLKGFFLEMKAEFKSDQLMSIGRFTNLLSFLYYRLHPDIVQGKKILTCQNESCSHFFIPRHPDQLFCSPQCRNRERIRRHRQRQREQTIDLYLQGLAIDAIADRVGAEKYRIKSWIQSFRDADK